MKKSILLLPVILFMFNCSSHEENLIEKNNIVGEWTLTTEQNDDLQNRCEKTSTIKITEDGNYSISTFYKITDSENNSVIIDSSELTDTKRFQNWKKSEISNEYILTESNNQQILNTKTIVLKNNSIIDSENNVFSKK